MRRAARLPICVQVSRGNTETKRQASWCLQIVLATMATMAALNLQVELEYVVCAVCGVCVRACVQVARIAAAATAMSVGELGTFAAASRRCLPLRVRRTRADIPMGACV